MKTFNMLTIIGISVALFFSLSSFFGIHDIIFHPTIVLTVEGGDRGNNTSLFFINVNNTGTATATNVIVTINPDSNIIGTSIIIPPNT